MFAPQPSDGFHHQGGLAVAAWRYDDNVLSVADIVLNLGEFAHTVCKVVSGRHITIPKRITDHSPALLNILIIPKGVTPFGIIGLEREIRRLLTVRKLAILGAMIHKAGLRGPRQNVMSAE